MPAYKRSDLVLNVFFKYRFRSCRIFLPVLVVLLFSAAGCSGRTEDFIEASVSDDLSAAPEKEAAAAGEIVSPAVTEILVYVCGAVDSPGVYALPEGSRIYEACEAAGGLLPEAAEEAVNLAGEVYDGQQVRIPYASELADSSGGDASGEASDGRINLNTATLEELCTLPGIGEAKAQSILSYREEHGHFSSADELMQVEGIKEGIYNKIKDKITAK